MLLFSNPIQINIGIAFSKKKKKPVAKAKVLKFVFCEYKTPHCILLRLPLCFSNLNLRRVNFNR